MLCYKIKTIHNNKWLHTVIQLWLCTKLPPGLQLRAQGRGVWDVKENLFHLIKNVSPYIWISVAEEIRLMDVSQTPLHKSPEKSTYRHISVTVASPCSLPCSAWLRLRSNCLFCYLSDSHDKRCWNSLNAMERCSNAFFLRSFSIRYAGRLWRPTVPCSSSIGTGTLTYLLPISRKKLQINTSECSLSCAVIPRAIICVGL